MPSELERRLERALSGAPGPDPGVSDRALRAALEALPSPADLRRARRRRVALLLAACLAAFVSGGMTLAATGAHLPVVNPEPATTHAPPAEPTARPDASLLPADAAIWVTSRGRATVVTARGTPRRWHGRRLAAFAASPGSLYLVEGRSTMLRAVETRTGRVAWGRGDLGGRPVAAEWSPFPIRIAYVLRTARGYTVGDLWGTGTHPFTVDTDAAPVMPAWRWDSKALAYVTASGAVVVHDVIGGANHPLGRACGIRRPLALAFAPAGTTLAVADAAGRVALVDTSGGRDPRCLTGPAGRPHLAWLTRRALLAAAGSTLTRYGVSGAEAAARTVSTGRPVESLAASPDGRRIVIALRGRTSTAVVATTPPGVRSPAPALADGLTLLHLAGPVQVQWR